jgi:hypothetical protein
MGSGAQSLEEARTDLTQRLRPRRLTIEESIVAQVRRAAPNPAEIEEGPEYIAGLRVAVTAIVDYGLMGLEQGEEWSGPIPSSAIAQAHRAARDGVSLDTVLRRYALGDRVLGEFVMDEVESLSPRTLRHVFRAQGSLLDRLMASIATEYRQETERVQRSPEQRRAHRVQKLLAGEPVDKADVIDDGQSLRTFRQRLGRVHRGQSYARAHRGSHRRIGGVPAGGEGWRRTLCDPARRSPLL